MRFLIFGDVVGRLGRQAITRVLPDLRAEHDIDSVIINIENIAHGKGISPSSMQEALMWEADAYTTGDHAWDNKGGISFLEDKKYGVIRPANYPEGVSGRGYYIFNNGIYSVAVINLQGQVFFKNDPLNPFLYIDQLLEKEEIKKADIVLLDFHADATSEMRAMGWHVDGRITAMWGTHGHVPTADAQVFSKGTGYITDIGMTGGYHTIIGVKPDGPLKSFLTQTKQTFEPPENGPMEVNALLLEVSPENKKTISIAHIRKIINA